MPFILYGYMHILKMRSNPFLPLGNFNYRCYSLLIAGLLFSIIPLGAKENTKRIVSLSGSLTEIIYSLGAQNLLVGTDTTSYFPEQANQLPKVGYQRSLSLEGILSLKPDLVLGTEEAGPPETLDRLKKLGIEVLIHDSKPGLQSTLDRIQLIGETIGETKVAQEIIDRIHKNVITLQKNTPWKIKPKVLMVFSRGRNMIVVAGKETSGSAMIELAGAENYISEFSGFKPLTPEILLKNKMDVILLTDMSLKALGGKKEFWKLPGFQAIPESKRPNIITMDDLLLLGFSSRLDSALEELQIKIKKSSK